MNERIRTALRTDVPLIFEFIRKLADFEKLAHEVVASEDLLNETLFGAAPAAEVIIAEIQIQDQWRGVGFALFFTSYSTFLAKPGLYLEDLFVVPEYRSRGLGRQLLVHLANLANSRGYGRMEWSVLDWNQRAWEFYRSLGALPQEDWTRFKLQGESLAKLASVSK